LDLLGLGRLPDVAEGPAEPVLGDAVVELRRPGTPVEADGVLPPVSPLGDPGPMLEEPWRLGEVGREPTQLVFHVVELARLVEACQKLVPGFDAVRAGLDHPAESGNPLLHLTGAGLGQAER